MSSTPEASASESPRKSPLPLPARPKHLTQSVYRRKPLSYTFMSMVFWAVLIWFCSFKVTEWYQLGDDGLLSHSRMAVILIMLMFGGMAALYLHDGLIKRPSQKLWKFITGLSMFYLMVIVYMLFLSRTQTQTVLGNFFDNSLGKALPEKSYASDCRIYTPQFPNKFRNLFDSFFDVFMLAHLIGWFFKILICRDIPLVLFQSVLFEVLEVCLRHLLPNFYECWWDHLVLDILGCNLIGIIVGWQVIKAYKLERLKWSLRDGPLKKTFLRNMKLFWFSFDTSQVQYKFMTSTKKFLQVMWFVVFMPLVDLTLFFNKFVLRIPSWHYINSFRTFLMGMLSISASKEYYHYITRRDNQMRVNVFLLQSIVFAEILLFFKNYDGQFTNIDAPFHAKAVFYLFAGIFVSTLGKIVASDVFKWARKRRERRVKAE